MSYVLWRKRVTRNAERFPYRILHGKPAVYQGGNAKAHLKIDWRTRVILRHSLYVLSWCANNKSFNALKVLKYWWFKWYGRCTELYFFAIEKKTGLQEKLNSTCSNQPSSCVELRQWYEFSNKPHKLELFMTWQTEFVHRMDIRVSRPNGPSFRQAN